jgi:hypothetical protein
MVISMCEGLFAKMCSLWKTLIINPFMFILKMKIESKNIESIMARIK